MNVMDLIKAGGKKALKEIDNPAVVRSVTPETTPKAVGGEVELLRTELRDLENQQRNTPSRELLKKILRAEDMLREARLIAGEKLLITSGTIYDAKRFFHGTPSKNIIKEFEINRDASPNSYGGHGAIWVSNQADHAKQYGDRVYEVNLKSNRLFNTAKNKEDRDLFEGWVRERVDKGENIPIFGEEVKNGYAPGDDQYFFNAILGDFAERRSDKSYFPAWENNDWLVDKVKSTGKYDGLIVSSQNGELDIGVFSPKQAIVKGYFKKNGDFKKVSLPNPSRSPEGSSKAIIPALGTAAMFTPKVSEAGGLGEPIQSVVSRMGNQAPVGAVLSSWRNPQAAERQALQESLVDPTLLMAGPARLGGGIGNMAIDSVMKAITSSNQEGGNMNVMDLMRAGRNGDTMIAHINPKEAAVLKSMGGSGTINPKTGLPEFWDGGDGYGGETAGMSEGGPSGGTSSVGDGFYGGETYGMPSPVSETPTYADMPTQQDAITGTWGPNNKANVGMFEGLANNVTGNLAYGIDSLMADPLGTLSSWGGSILGGVKDAALGLFGANIGSTLGAGVLGAINPALGLFGALAGGYFGQKGAREIANMDFDQEPDEDVGLPDSYNTAEAGSGSDGITGIAALSQPTAPISNAIMPAYNMPAYNIQKEYPWSYLSASGRGGGGLTRLMR